MEGICFCVSVCLCICASTCLHIYVLFWWMNQTLGPAGSGLSPRVLKLGGCVIPFLNGDSKVKMCIERNFEFWLIVGEKLAERPCWLVRRQNFLNFDFVILCDGGCILRAPEVPAQWNLDLASPSPYPSHPHPAPPTPKPQHPPSHTAAKPDIWMHDFSISIMPLGIRCGF